MKVRSRVEPPEPMHGLEIPREVVEALGGGARPKVTITINGHSWRSRVAIMRGRHLIGLSNANRKAAGVETGDEVEVDLELDTEPRVVPEPTDLATALDADRLAREAFDRLPYGVRRRDVDSVEDAKSAETRRRRIDRLIATLHGS
jgi:Domain of unknown function (DUF1905)/Bacteriocin-protection, YdeI or OmpD-Associated